LRDYSNSNYSNIKYTFVLFCNSENLAYSNNEYGLLLSQSGENI
jgi:hypothetical protein